MAVATFDTLKFANTLKAAGVPDKQAEAQAVAFSEVIQTNFKELASKEDLKIAVDTLKSDLRDTETRLKSDFNLLKWMIGSLGFGILAVIIRLFVFRTP